MSQPALCACETKVNGFGYTEIVYCPLHAQTPAIRAVLARLVATEDNPSAHALYMDEARAILKETE